MFASKLTHVLALAAGRELGQVDVAEDGTALVTEPDVGIVLGKGGAGGSAGKSGMEPGFRDTEAPRDGGVGVQALFV